MEVGTLMIEALNPLLTVFAAWISLLSAGDGEKFPSLPSEAPIKGKKGFDDLLSSDN